MWSRRTTADALRRRNFIENGVGVLTDRHGLRWYVDLEDFQWAKEYLWCAHKADEHRNYAGNTKIGYLHKAILPGAKIVDHIDRNTHNNRKSNLRAVDHATNRMNSRRADGYSSKYRCVCKLKDKWMAFFTFDSIQKYIGIFDSEEDAGFAVWRYAQSVGREMFYVNPKA